MASPLFRFFARLASLPGAARLPRWLAAGAIALLCVAGAQAQTLTGAITPTSTPVGLSANVTVNVSITDPQLIASSVNLQRVDPLGRATVVGNLHDDGLGGDAIAGDRIYAIRFPVYEERPTTLSFRVSAAFQGRITRVFSNPLAFSVTGGSPTGVTITSPAPLAFVNTPAVIVSGTAADPDATVAINGVPAVRSGTGFQASIPLIEGTNTITAVATNRNGSASTASIQATLDTTPPRVTIDSPPNGFTTPEPTIGVSGIVNDIVVGTINPQQARVTVNGAVADVANRTFSLAAVPLQVGANVIRVTGRDQTGNSSTAEITVVRRAADKVVRIVSGNAQSGPIGTRLAAPLVVQVSNAGVPVANASVIFKVTENDAYFEPVALRQQSIVVRTNAQGQAQVQVVLGNRAGAGNNTVEAYAVGYEGTALFVASGRPKSAAMINVDSGNNQFGAVGQPLALPFVAVVTDVGYNRLGGIPVTFTVRQGNGRINGLTTFQTTTDSDGRVLATLTLGPLDGQDNNVVEATFPGNTGFAAAFAASGWVPGNPADTVISGVVLDNANQPIRNVTMRMFRIHLGTANNQPVQVGTPVLTDANGVFRITGAPVGFVKLMADGTTATDAGRLFPTLEYEMVTIAGRENTVGAPVYLPELDPNARVCVSETRGGTLRMASSPGFALTILPGSATFPGGSRTGCVTVTPVNPDKVPMAPGFGQQPRYVVTIQPVGTTFNPPAAISIPNVDGLAPNAKTEMYSFDHDLAAFVAIGSGSVSADGAVIASDTGVGVIKAGWHCGGNPATTGSAGTCPTCQKCVGSNCNPDNAQVPPQSSPTDCKKEICSGGGIVSQNNDTERPSGFCKTCKDGQPKDVDLGDWKADAAIGANAKLPDNLKNLLEGGINRIPGVNIQLEELKFGVQGKAKDCCDPANGDTVSLGKKEGSASVQATIRFRNVQIWPLPPTVIDKRWLQPVFGEIVEVRILFLAGAFLRSDLIFGGEGGIRTDACGSENCAFGGLTADVTAGIALEAAAQGCFSTSLSNTDYCSPTIDVSFAPLTVNVQGRAGFNQANCSAGLSGSLKLVGVKASFEFKLPLLPTLSAEYELFGGVCILGSC